GWQYQPKVKSVQAILNKALSQILRESIETTGAGRTDTGVHAKYFVAHFDSKNLEIQEKEKVIFSMNGMLPYDIVILNIYKVKNDNHARFDAITRTYEYIISKKKNPFLLEQSYLLFGNLNVSAMNLACDLLLHYNDFTSFSKLHSDVKTNICNISRVSWIENNDLLIFTITADRFLRNMVRAIVGTMIEIGFNKISLNYFAEIIESKDRSKAGASAPAYGLFLTDIQYPYDFKSANYPGE
ncbi:tRNA pseudouridine(38-40) synthase TruA, partial [Bacteroidota bacterium]